MKIKELLIILLLTPLMPLSACGDSNTPEIEAPDPGGKEDPDPDDSKEIYYPSSVWNVAENNNYQSESSQFSIHRMSKTPNLVAFWEKGFGNDPSSTSDTKFRFPLKDMMEESDKMFIFFRDKLKFVEKGKSLTDKYKMTLYIYYNEDGTVYGGGADNKIGVMWLSPGRVKTKPYGAMAHEMGHAFQYMVSVDGGWGYSSSPAGSRGQAIFEMTSQYMLWQYYPDWITFENYHLETFMTNTHKAFLHEDNRYCSPFVLEYWADKHGIDFIGKLWRESKQGEDPVMTYKRLTEIDQEKFNDEILDAGRKFITWDMERVKEASAAYINKHTSAFTSVGNGWYQIAEKRCPQNYGYNGVQLEVPTAGTEVVLDFKGVAGASGFRDVNKDKAGWRYGFVALKENGERVYGDVYSKATGQAKFIVPEKTTHLWLVVTGAPTQHWEHIWDENTGNDEQWPYQIKLTGTTLHSSVQK